MGYAHGRRRGRTACSLPAGRAGRPALGSGASGRARSVLRFEPRACADESEAGGAARLSAPATMPVANITRMWLSSVPTLDSRLGAAGCCRSVQAALHAHQLDGHVVSAGPVLDGVEVLER